MLIKPDKKVDPNLHRHEYKDKSAHITIARRCEDMARLIYESNCRLPSGVGNKFYKDNPDIDHFVRIVAPDLIKAVKEEMVDALADESLPLEERDAIHEALVLDASLKGADTWQKV